MTANPNVRARFWWEAGLGVVTAGLAVITLISHEWVEVVFRVDPDRGSGLLEWAVVVALAVATVACGILARAEWRRADPAHSDG
jgi:hypothetical protein